jgi:stage V sporulation protein G
VDITEVRVKLMNDKTEKLQAFCSITISNDFVVRDLKIIEGSSGPFVAMPSRKLAEKCPKCGCKNHLRANYCNECGGRLKSDRAARDDKGRTKLHADIAHPINSQCREELQKKVLAAYQEEIDRSKQEGYVPPRYDEEFEEVEAEEVEAAPPPPQQRPAEPPREFHRPPERREQPQRSHQQPAQRAQSPQKPVSAEKPAEEAGLDDDLDAALDSPLEDYKQEKNRRDNDDFGSGIFT